MGARVEKLKVYIAAAIAIMFVVGAYRARLPTIFENAAYGLVLAAIVLVSPVAFLVGLVAIPFIKFGSAALKKLAANSFPWFVLLAVAAALCVSGIMYVGTVGGLTFYGNGDNLQLKVGAAFDAANKRVWIFFWQVLCGLIGGGLVTVWKDRIDYESRIKRFRAIFLNSVVYVVLIAVFCFGFFLMTPELLNAGAQTIISNFFTWLFGALHFPIDVVQNFATDPWYIFHYIGRVISEAGGNLFKLEPLYPRALVIGLLLSLAFNLPKLLFHHPSV
jgi:hypothetical protein